MIRVENHTTRPHHVAVVGSGPSGFYAAAALLDAELDVRVDMFDRLATPWGLVRLGVAPEVVPFRKLTAERLCRLQGSCERCGIPCRHDPASLSFPNPFRRAVVASCHHGHAAGHGFSHRERRAVFERRQDEKLRSLEDGQRIARLASD